MIKLTPADLVCKNCGAEIRTFSGGDVRRDTTPAEISITLFCEACGYSTRATYPDDGSDPYIRIRGGRRIVLAPEK